MFLDNLIQQSFEHFGIEDKIENKIKNVKAKRPNNIVSGIMILLTTGILESIYNSSILGTYLFSNFGNTFFLKGTFPTYSIEDPKQPNRRTRRLNQPGGTSFDSTYGNVKPEEEIYMEIVDNDNQNQNKNFYSSIKKTNNKNEKKGIFNNLNNLDKNEVTYLSNIFKSENYLIKHSVKIFLFVFKFIGYIILVSGFDEKTARRIALIPLLYAFSIFFLILSIQTFQYNSSKKYILFILISLLLLIMGFVLQYLYKKPNNNQETVENNDEPSNTEPSNAKSSDSEPSDAEPSSE